MQINPGVILGQNQPDFMNALARSTQAAGLTNQVMDENRLRTFNREQGAALMNGDQNALAAYAGINPQGAMQIKSQQEAQRRARAAAARAAANAAQSREKRAQLEQEFAEMRRGALAYTSAQDGSPEGVAAWSQWSQEHGVSAEQFPLYLATAEEGMKMLQAMGAAQEFTAEPEAPKPLSTAGKIEADYRAGLIEGDAYSAAMNKATGSVGTTTTFDPATGSFVVQTGVQSGGLGPAPAQSLPTDAATLGRENAKDDAGFLSEAREQAAAADALNLNLAAADALLQEGRSTGRTANIRGVINSLSAEAGFGEGRYAAWVEDLEAVSKTIGIDTLKAVGGNDTERELLTAIQTTVSATKRPEANFRILARQKAAIDVITQKPVVMQNWIATNGSLANSTEAGAAWDTYWREYQMDEFSRRSNQYLASYGVERVSPQAAQESVTSNAQMSQAFSSAMGGLPDGGAQIWENMTPEERALWN